MAHVTRSFPFLPSAPLRGRAAPPTPTVSPANNQTLQSGPPARLPEADFVQFPFSSSGGNAQGASGIPRDNGSCAGHHRPATPPTEPPLSSATAAASETGDAGELTGAASLREGRRAAGGEAWPRCGAFWCDVM